MTNAVHWILDHRWAMTPHSLSALVDIARRNATVPIDTKLFHKGDYDVDPKNSEVLSLSRKEALLVDDGVILEGTRDVVLRGNTAVIPVLGPIFPRSNMFTAYSGATSLSAFSSSFNTALSDGRVKSIILDVDSPGGEITDVEAMSQMIFEARELKHITAFVSGIGASAAYWLASAAHEIQVAKTGEVGSIGVVAAIQDSSEKDAKDGIQNIQIVSSISPNKRPDFSTKEGRQGVQDIVNDLGVIFADTVARNRNTDFKDVVTNFGKGDVLLAQRALDAGMIDGISSLETLISRNNLSQSTSGGTMSKLITEASTPADIKAENPGVYNAIIAEGKKEAVNDVDVDAKVAKAREEGAEAENTRIKNIEAINVPGSDKIIAENKFARTETVESISVKVLQSQQGLLKANGQALGDDGRELANNIDALGNAQSDTNVEDDAEQKSVRSAMIAGINA